MINCTNLHQKVHTSTISKSRINQKRAFVRGKLIKKQAPLVRLERTTAGFEELVRVENNVYHEQAQLKNRKPLRREYLSDILDRKS